jgi:uncharacterized protein YqgC (DUF456 family)
LGSTLATVDAAPDLENAGAMQALALFLALFFSALGLGCLVLVIVGLPGTWLMIAIAVGIELLDTHWLTAGSRLSFGWWPIGASVVLAAAGEIVETWTAAAGLAAGGGSRRGMWGAILGGLIGGLLLTGLVPIPLVGTVVGAAAGAFLGALGAELTGIERAGTASSLKAATGAAIGRVLGTFGKTILAVAIWVLLTVAALWTALG